MFAFLIPVHIGITKYALNKVEHSLNWKARFVFLFANSFFTDIIGVSRNWHFDSLKDYNSILNYWNNIENQIFNPENNLLKLGRLLHTIQDFYAHSNYVELFIKYCFDSEQIDRINNIQPFYLEISDLEFVEKYLKPSLVTGEFNLLKYLIGIDRKTTNKKGFKHHDDIAKDNLKMGDIIQIGNIKINTFDIAKELAQKDSILTLIKLSENNLI
jgi:hypothetical protein